MGKEIVYCEGCGTNLRESDFSKGTAHMVENSPFCTTCRPKPAAAPAKTPTSRIPVYKPPSGRKTQTGRIPTAAPGQPRRNPPPKKPASHLPIILVSVAAAVLVIIMIAFVLSRRSGGDRPRPPVPSESP